MPIAYRICGLSFSSSDPIPGLVVEAASGAPPDFAFELGGEPDWAKNGRGLTPSTRKTRAFECGADPAFRVTAFGNEELFELAYGDGTRFAVDDRTKRLWGTCPAPLTVEDLATYLLGPVVGFILRRRGITALHASTICISGRAVVFCGESEAGKSTTAAALALRGFPVLTEDISPIREDSGVLYVEPGYPRICLWPDAVEKLFGNREALPNITPNWEKRFLALDGGRVRFERERRPLGAVYVLAPRTEEATAPRIEELTKREGLLQLVQNTYMNYLLDREQRAAELGVLASIVSKVPVRRIIPHRDPARIGALCDLIIKDAERLFDAREPVAQVSGA